jgi:O-antigen/teichoic acid export membrane protein
LDTSPRRIAANSAYLLAANFLSMAITFVYIALIYRFIAQEVEGYYIIACNWGSILVIHLHPGMVYILIREIAVNRDRTSELLGDGLIISGFLFIVVMALACVGAMLLVYVKGDPSVVGLGIVAIAFALGLTYVRGIFSAGFVAHEKLIYSAILLVFHAMVTLAVLWFICREPYTLLHIFIAIAAISVVTNSLAWALGCLVLGTPSLRWRRESLRYLMRESIPLGVAEAVRINYMRAGNIALWLFHQYTLVSSFGIPYQITEQLKVIPGSIRPAIFPAMCRLAGGNKRGFEWLYNFLMRLLVIIALPLGLMLMAAAGLILTVVTKDPTPEAITALRVLSLIIIISFPSLVVRNIFIALGKQKLDTVISSAALAMLVVLLIISVPANKVFGAVASIFIAEMFLFAMGIFYVYRLGFRLDFTGTFLKPVICTVPLIVAMLLTPREGFIGMRLAIYLACIALYVLLIFATRTLSRDDIDNLRRVARGEDPAGHNSFQS